MKIYNRNGEIVLSENIPHNAILVCDRAISDDEIIWPKWNTDKTDVTVDTVAKKAWEESEKTKKIEIIKSGLKEALKNCDHTQLSDFAYPNDKPVWDMYRTALRADMAAMSSRTYAQILSYVKPVRPF